MKSGFLINCDESILIENTAIHSPRALENALCIAEPPGQPEERPGSQRPYQQQRELAT